MNEMCEPLINVDRAAELLGIHPKTVKRLAASGRIPGMRIGKLWRFRESVLDVWMRTEIDSSRHPRPQVEGGR
jgi:excisionase family DNA binding protein